MIVNPMDIRHQDKRSGAAVRLSVDKVTKKFERRQNHVVALKEVSLDIRAGEHLSIVGPTGCGKTTLLNIVAGFDYPTTGEVRIDGRRVDGPSSSCGVIFQQANVFPWLTVMDNILFAARFGKTADGVPLWHPNIESEAKDLIREVGLEGSEKMFPYEISGGMKARAALARVLLVQPSLMLLDEPFVALDAQTRGSMHRLLVRLMKGEAGRSMMLITHDVDEAVMLADRVYVMSRAPGSVVGKIEVPFGFPRDYSAIARDTLFLKCRNEVLDLLEPLID